MRTSKRDRIITAALELAHRDGFDALTFDALADNVSVEGLIDAVFNAVPVP